MSRLAWLLRTFACWKAVLSMRIVVCVLWALAAGAGTVALWNYESAAGHAGGTPEHWPPQAQITLDPQRATLLMFAHPRCPCSRASLGELNRLLARYPGRVAAHLLFLK